MRSINFIAEQLIIVGHVVIQDCRCVIWTVDCADLIESDHQCPVDEVVCTQLQKLPVFRHSTWQTVLQPSTHCLQSSHPPLCSLQYGQSKTMLLDMHNELLH